MLPQWRIESFVVKTEMLKTISTVNVLMMLKEIEKENGFSREESNENGKYNGKTNDENIIERTH